MAQDQEFSLKTEVFDWLEAIGFSIAAIILVFTLFFRTAQVEGSSMLPNLVSGDRVILVNTALSPIEREDVVVITQPTVIGQPLIKRVIATEGQKVFINYETGDVFVDDILLEEGYIKEKINEIPGDAVSFPLIVGEGKVFVMGDNRNASTDSRNAIVGEIDTRYILGKAVLRIFPFDSISVIK